MGTRGYVCFRKRCSTGTSKLFCVYNHFDSYPSALGADLVEELRKALADGSIYTWITLFINLKIVYPNSPPPTWDEIIRYYKGSINMSHRNMSQDSTGLWTCNYQSNIFPDGNYSFDGKTITYPLSWYNLSSDVSGSFVKIFDSGMLYQDTVLEEKDLPGEEYAYVYDLDTMKFEVHSYNGVQIYDLDKLPDF